MSNSNSNNICQKTATPSAVAAETGNTSSATNILLPPQGNAPRTVQRNPTAGDISIMSYQQYRQLRQQQQQQQQNSGAATRIVPIGNLMTTNNGGLAVVRNTQTNNNNNAGNATTRLQEQFQRQLAAVSRAQQQDQQQQNNTSQLITKNANLNGFIVQQQQQQNTKRYFLQLSQQPGNSIGTNTATIHGQTPNISQQQQQQQQQQQNAHPQQIVRKAHNTTATITLAQWQQLQVMQQQQRQQLQQQQQVQQQQQQPTQILPHSVQQQHRFGPSTVQQIKLNQHQKLFGLQRTVATAPTAAATQDTNSNDPTISNIQHTIVPNGSAKTTAAAVEGTEPQPQIDIVIYNVVCSFSVRCHLKLRDIAKNGDNVEYHPENGMVTMKLRRPYTTASIWSSGRITCTGATSESDAKIAARRFTRILQKLRFRVRFEKFRVVNVLGTCSMPWAIKIVHFAEKFKKEASYEPELHPGVTYTMRVPKATLKIFSTGSITVTAASVAIVQTAIEHIYPLVYEFRRQRSPQETEQLRLKRVNADFKDMCEPDERPSTSKATTKSKQRKRRRLSSKEELLEWEADDPDGAADDHLITEEIEELMEVDPGLIESSDDEKKDDLIEELEEVFRHHDISKSVQIVDSGIISGRKW